MPVDDGGCLGGDIVEGRFANRRYDVARCTSRVYTHWVPGFQKGLEAALDEEDAERRKMILYSSFFTRTLWSMTYAVTEPGPVLRVHARLPGRRRTSANFE